MKLVLKDGTELEMLDGSYGSAFIFFMADINDIPTIASKLTEDNLSSFTIDGVEYTNYLFDSGSWTKEVAIFNVHPKSEMEYIKEYVDADSFPDDQAINVPSLYDVWMAGVYYEVGKRVRHGDKLFKCLQSHTSQADWAPSVAPSLWTVVTVEEWPEWVQPTGAHDAYAKDAKVSHNGIHYVSDVDGNVWEPPTMWTER